MIGDFSKLHIIYSKRKSSLAVQLTECQTDCGANHKNGKQIIHLYP